jgi:uncharacterized protein
MKVIIQDNQRYILRFDKGEQVLKGLADFMEAQKIKSCTFTGIGTISHLEMGFYNSHLKEYRKKPFLDDMEIVSLIGNGGILASDGKPVIHAHGIFGKIDFSVIGGHVFEIVSLATCEIFLTKLEGEMKREHNADLNLNLLV